MLEEKVVKNLSIRMISREIRGLREAGVMGSDSWGIGRLLRFFEAIYEKFENIA
ncbi:MAG: hypothetical protein LBU83_11170 [Bacteroidales bacterium]|jgi:hypothetical protein|nr:hypothetical protein [Bacteroidales bacterium]